MRATRERPASLVEAGRITYVPPVLSETVAGIVRIMTEVTGGWATG